MHHHIHRLLCALSLFFVILSATLAHAGPVIVTFDLELPDGQSVPSFGQTILNDVHATTNEWVGGRTGDNGAAGGGGGYHVRDPLRVTDVRCPQHIATSVQSINTARSLVGGCTHNDVFVGYWRSAAGQVKILQPPGATFTHAMGHNDGDVVVGFFKTGATAPWQVLFYRTKVNSLRVFTPPVPHGSAIGQAINTREEVIGMVSTATSGWEGFFHSKQGWLTIIPPEAVETIPLDLNDQGQIVGMYADPSFRWHPFLWQAGQFFTITLPDAVHVELASLTNDGRLGGSYTTLGLDGQTTVWRGFIARDVALTPLTAPPAALQSRAMAKASTVQDPGTSALCHPSPSRGGTLTALASTLCPQDK